MVGVDRLAEGIDIETAGAIWLTSADLFPGAFDAKLAHERGALHAVRHGVVGRSGPGAVRTPAPELRHEIIALAPR